MKRIKTKEIKYNLLNGFALGDKVIYESAYANGSGVGVIIAFNNKEDGVCIATTCEKFSHCEGMKSVKYRINFSNVIYNKKVIRKLLKKNNDELYAWWLDAYKITKVDELA